MGKNQDKSVLIILLIALAIFAFSKGGQFAGLLNTGCGQFGSGAECDDFVRQNKCVDYPGADVYECVHGTAETLICIDEPAGTCESVNEANGYICVSNGIPCPGVGVCDVFTYTCSNGDISLSECNDNKGVITTCGDGFRCAMDTWEINVAQSTTHLKDTMCSVASNDCVNPPGQQGFYWCDNAEVKLCQVGAWTPYGTCGQGDLDGYDNECAFSVTTISDSLSGMCKCTVTTWAPNRALTCEGTDVVQTSNCGDTRTVEGTKDCVETPPPGDECAPWEKWNAENQECGLNMGIIILLIVGVLAVKMMRN